MPKFLGKKLKAAGGDPSNSMLVRFGAKKVIGGVEITTVPAAHSNGLSGKMIGGDLGASMFALGLTAYVGPPTGYVIKFSNGLVAYLSGDTGMTAEQKEVVGKYYGAELVVINIGDTFTTGPKEAAFVVNDMIKPVSVIASHANEQATENGELLPNTRTALFKSLVKVPVHLPLSGKTKSFDGAGLCKAGC